MKIIKELSTQEVKEAGIHPSGEPCLSCLKPGPRFDYHGFCQDCADSYGISGWGEAEGWELSEEDFQLIEDFKTDRVAAKEKYGLTMIEALFKAMDEEDARKKAEADE